MNLFLVLPLLYLPVIGTKLALCNLTICVVNLLPLPSSDGLRILRTLWLSRPASQISVAAISKEKCLTHQSPSP